MTAIDRLTAALGNVWKHSPSLLFSDATEAWMSDEALAAAVLAADPGLAVALDLGLAWQDTEAALPDQTWGIGLYRRHPDEDDEHDWLADAECMRCDKYDCPHGLAAAGPTPAAALRSLAEQLRGAE